MKKPRFTSKSLITLMGVAVAAALVATSCSSDSAAPNTPASGLASDVETILLSSSLETLDSCEAVLDRIKSDALERVGPYGLEQPGAFAEGVAVDDGSELTTPPILPESGDLESRNTEGADLAEDSPIVEAPNATAGSDQAKDTSGTNNQEEGVDEADLVKSDGQTLAIVSGSQLRVLDVSGEQPKLTKTISIASLGHPTGMFLNGDRLVLLSVDYDQNRFRRGGQATSLLTEVDLKAGTVGGSAEFEGQYVSSREVDGTLRMVLTAVPSELDFVYPDGRTDEHQAEQENRDIIEGSELEDWIPEYRVSGNTEQQSSRPLVDCSAVHIPKTFSGGGQVVVVTTDLDSPLEVTDALSVHSDAQTVYASTERLVVASPQWPNLSDPHDSGSFSTPFRSALHSFDISTPSSTDYLGSGSVRGLLLNQFSLSEHNGKLRVATTDEAARSGWVSRILGDVDVEPATSESFVTILSESGGALVPDGQVGGLGRGERIFAVRFIGNVGYVVTFRETDPLYTIDLSNPTNPQVIGELKIPGFSNYLHEIDDRTLMGVGSDGTEDGQVLGAAVSLFDVEDLSDPTRLDKLAFENDSATPIANDAKAFTYWAKTNTAIIPLETYRFNDGAVTSQDRGEYYEGYISEAAVVDVDPEQGRIKLRGTIDHQAQCNQPSTTAAGRRVPRAQMRSASLNQGQTRPAPDDLVVDRIPVAPPPDIDLPKPTIVVDPEPPVEPPVAPQLPVDPEEYYPEPCNQSTAISRTMVIGEDLYTFSNAGIAVHQLDTLAEKAWVSFS